MQHGASDFPVSSNTALSSGPLVLQAFRWHPERETSTTLRSSPHPRHPLAPPHPTCSPASPTPTGWSPEEPTEVSWVCSGCPNPRRKDVGKSKQRTAPRFWSCRTLSWRPATTSQPSASLPKRKHTGMVFSHREEAAPDPKYTTSCVFRQDKTTQNSTYFYFVVLFVFCFFFSERLYFVPMQAVWKGTAHDPKHTTS